MTIPKIMLAGAAALAIVSIPAFADQAQTGMVTKIDRINRTVLIQPVQSGTVGANTTGTAQEFKAKEGMSLDEVHVGDLVSYSAMDASGTKTITKLDRKK
jgi:Copper binding periplasmic protein CusF